MKQKIYFLLAMLFCITLQTMAQTDGDNPEDREVDMDAPTFEPMVKVGKVLLDHDSVQYVQVNNVYVYPQPVFKNAKERMAYNRLVYNIKKVLPIAKEVRKIIIETGDYLETLPNKKAKDAHMPGAKLFGSEDLYADQYLFVNGYPKRILANGGTPVGILSSDGYAAEDSLSLCDAFVFCGGARFYPYHFQVMEYAAKSGKPVLGICLGMQMMNTYFLVAEEAERRGWDGPLLALFEQMKKERYMFTEPVDGHWDGHITRDNVDRFKHPIHVTPGSRLERLTGKQTILGASMHNYRITHPARSLTVAGRTDDGTIEALEYGEQMLGVQFHPEADDQNDELFRAIL